MRILQICPRVPYPLHDGGAIGMFNITKHLALRGHQIHMAAFGKEDSTSLEGLREHCEPTLVKHDTSTRRIDAAANLFSKIPYTISKYHLEAMYRVLSEIVKQAAIEVVHVDLLHMATYGIFLKKNYNLPIILREHNFESTLMERFLRNQTNPALRWYAGNQYRKLRSYEPRIGAQFDRCVMITRDDEQRIRALSNQLQTVVIPAGVDLPDDTDSREKPGSILFLASLDWPPNVDGFFWFYENVFPHILRAEPEIHLSILGKGDSPRLKQLVHPNIHFIGFVEDVVPYIKSAKICIVPLFAGGGMRIKILEMFAHRKCVVSTSIGSEGIDVQDECELLIADDPVEFAQKLLCAFRDRKLRQFLGNNARKLVENKYAWPQVGAAFEKVYDEVINTKKLGKRLR